MKAFYQLKNNAALAQFLGIEANTLSNWYARDTIDFDLLFSKCNKIDLNWLITGATKNINPNDYTIELTDSQPQQKNHEEIPDQEIDRLKKLISIQEETISAQAKTIKLMEKLIND